MNIYLIKNTLHEHDDWDSNEAHVISAHNELEVRKVASEFAEEHGWNEGSGIWLTEDAKIIYLGEDRSSEGYSRIILTSFNNG